MKEPHFAEVLSQLTAFKGLRKLNLNGAVEKIKAPQPLVNSLVGIVQNGLEELSLSDSVGKATILPFLKKISPDCQLKKIDISDNQLLDDGISAVCTWLRNARHIESINLDNNRVTLNGLMDLCTVLSLNVVLSDICIENDYQRELNQLTGFAKKRLMQVMTRITLSLHQHDGDDQPFWVTGSETALTLPAPTQQNELPPAPSYFSEKPAEQGPTTVQLDSMEIEPQKDPMRDSQRKIARTTHRPIIASRVQNTSSGTPQSPSGAPPTLNAPPTLAAPPSLSTPNQRKAPPMLSVPGGPTSPTSESPRVATTTTARRPGAMVAKRATAARRPGVSGAPKAQLTRAPSSTSGHGSRNFEPTTQLQHDLEAEAEEPAAAAEEPDPDMPTLQPVTPPRPAKAAPQLKPVPEKEPEPEAQPEVQSPHTPSAAPARRMLIGQRQPRAQ